MKIAVCIHLYHIDMIDQIIGYLNNLEYEYDLFISLVKNYPESFLRKLRNITKNTKILIVENKGMDVGGFLQVYKTLDKSYDLILKIHTKKGLGSAQKPSRFFLKHGIEETKKRGERWFNRSMNGVLQNKTKVKTIIERFQNNKDCGMTGVKLYNNWNPNVELMNDVFNLMNLKVNYDNYFFVGGTIFWVRNSIFKKYLTDEIIDKILNISPEGYAYEPSINHAMERVFGCLVFLDNKQICN